MKKISIITTKGILLIGYKGDVEYMKVDPDIILEKIAEQWPQKILDMIKFLQELGS